MQFNKKKIDKEMQFLIVFYESNNSLSCYLWLFIGNHRFYQVVYDRSKYEGVQVVDCKSCF